MTLCGKKVGSSLQILHYKKITVKETFQIQNNINVIFSKNTTTLSDEASKSFDQTNKQLQVIISCRGLLFDMDGVIVDTHASVTALWENLAMIYHIKLTPDDYKTHIYGSTAMHTLENLFPHLTPEEQQKVFSYIAEYEDGLNYMPTPGILKLLQMLKEYETPTACVTGATTRKANEVRRQLGLDGLFMAWITGNQIHHGKPNPECYFLAADALGLDPKHCLVFEDAVNGVKAATGAGVKCVGINTLDMAPPLLEAGAYIIVPDFTHVTIRPTETAT